MLNPYAGELKIDKSRRRENYNVADGRYEQRVRWLRSILEYRVSDSTRWRNTFYHYDAERDYRNLETYRYNADNSGVVRSNAFLQRHDQQLNGNRFELQHSQPLFGLASDWALGFDYSINKQTRFRVPPPGRSVRSIRPVSSRATSTTCRACVPATGRTAATRCAPARCSPRTAWA